MSRTTLIAATAILGALALTGCLREDGTYVLNEDNTVDGTIVLALDANYADPTNPVSPFDANDIASHYVHATVSNLGQPGWVGDRISFVDEPITTFVTATEDWEITVSRVGAQYVVTGAAIDPNDASSKQTVSDEGGSMTLKVTFPGKVSEHNGSLSGRTVTWNMLTQDAAPYARGDAVPAAAAPPPAPEPVVTVVVTPAPTPPAAVESPSPTPTSSPTVIAAPEDKDSGSIPMWVWIVGGALVVAVVALGSFMLASKLASKPAAVVPAPAPEPAPAPPNVAAPADAVDAVADDAPPAAKTKKAPKAKPAEDDSE